MTKDNDVLNNNESLDQQNLFSLASKEIEEEKNNSISENIEIPKDIKEEVSFGNLFHSSEEQEENNLNINSILNETSTSYEYVSSLLEISNSPTT